MAGEVVKLRRWRWIVGWATLVALVAVAANGLDWPRLLGAAARAEPGWLAAAVLANGTILFFATAEWLLFVPAGARVPPRTMFSIVAVTSTVSNGGPLLAGHATGIHLLATRAGLGPAGGVSLTILDQIAEGLAKWTVLILAAAIVPDFEYRAAGMTIILGAPALALGFAALARRRDFLDRLAGEARGRMRAVLRFISQTVHRLDAIRRPAPFGLGVALAIAKKTAEALGIAAIALALGVDLLPWHVVGALLAVSLSTMFSITPANLGVYEGSIFLVFRAAGVDADVALALALLSHVAYLLPLAGTGLALESLRIWRGLEG